MNGVTFGTLHSYNNLSLILTSKKVEAPTPKTLSVEIEGADGELDLTEYFGQVNYKNRKLTFEFSYVGQPSNFMTVFSNIQNQLHGKKMHVILDDDPNYYYNGRITVSEWKANKSIGSITVEIDAEPYKYKLNQTTVSRSVTDSDTIVLTNDFLHAVPSITASAAFTIVFNGVTTAASAGTFTIPTLELSAGSNSISVTGTGTISFTWQEGRL